jgi:hypothetical protein
MDPDISAWKGRLALLFVAALGLSLALGFIAPRLIASLVPAASVSYNPPWLVYTALVFGFVAVVTVPFAWRWLYGRRR